MRLIQLRSLPMIGCRAAQRRLSEYLDGDLADDENRFVRMHLRRCPRCMKILRTLEAVIESLGHLPDADHTSGSIADAVERRLEPEA
jgi:anti-sigma factor RsiW